MYDKDLTGKVFGRLTVLELDHLEENGAQVWKCKCSCPEGNIVTATRKGLIAGTKKSCGCLAREARKKPNAGQFKTKIDPNDIIGKRFGKLIIGSLDHISGRHYYYKCKCDCGNYIVKRRLSILSAKEPPSCGCYKRELASSDIINIINLPLYHSTIMKINLMVEKNISLSANVIVVMNV